jgi:hypothetical protein
MPSEVLRRELRSYFTRLNRTFGRTNKLPAKVIAVKHRILKKVDSIGSAPIPIDNSFENALKFIAPFGIKCRYLTVF